MVSEVRIRSNFSSGQPSLVSSGTVLFSHPDISTSDMLPQSPEKNEALDASPAVTSEEAAESSGLVELRWL